MDVTGDFRLMGRVRFLRAGLVTPLPGGSGIALAGTMTGPRGASLDCDSGKRVTPAFPQVAGNAAWAEPWH
jgi:hypothetical protein